MMYKVIHEFADMTDEYHVYSEGDSYPRKGSKPSEERISELLGDSNKIGKPLIVEVPKEKPSKKTAD